MPVSVEDLIQMRDALIRARAKGVKTLRTGADSVEYKTDAEMTAAINDLEARQEMRARQAAEKRSRS